MTHIPLWQKATRLALIALCIAIILPILGGSLFAITSYLTDLLRLILPISDPAIVKISFALRAVAIAVMLCLFYYGFADWLSRKITGTSTKGIAINESLQPWIFLGPTIALLSVFLIYPAFATLTLSLFNDIPVLIEGAPVLNELGQNITEKGWVGLDNYRFLFASMDFWLAIRNSMLWLLVVPTACIVFGMTIAVLADTVRWGAFAKSLIFVPLAISFVGAAVIWRNIYAAGGAGGYQIGFLNAILSPFGVEPRFWYEMQFWGNFFMMVILIWIQTGFAMVIFSASLRSVPTETLEAARIDGGTEWQIFFKITLPQVYGTVLVVWTTLIILVLKVFDIPYALSANKSDKLLLATLMEQTRTAQREEEIAAAVAIILMLTILPVMVFNLWRVKRGAA